MPVTNCPCAVPANPLCVADERKTAQEKRLVDLRIPFGESIVEPKLLKARFDSLSVPQQVWLKVTYGLPLTTEAELHVWAATQEQVVTDDLGYPVSYLPHEYVPQKYSQAWAVLGRRSGKTDTFAATITAYEACCGGHEQFMRKGQRAMCFQVAQDLRMARYSLHFIRAALESSPLLKQMIVEVTADRIDLRNGMTIATVPPTVKSVRGYSAPVFVFDEVGSWYQESDSANPDYEIYRAALPSQLQFPDKLVVGIGTPWNKVGLLYKMYSAGTGGWKIPDPMPKDEYRNLLVMHAGTAAAENPLVTREFLEEERSRDPEAFAREELAQFQDSISGFIPVAAVDRAISAGLFERQPHPHLHYVAALDAGFRRDSFTFHIVHADAAGHVTQDLVREWRPKPGTPLHPEPILVDIAHLCQAFHVKLVYGDQYQLESLQSLARHYGLSIMGFDLTGRSKAKVMGNLQQLFLQQRIHLLDHYETARQIKTLERKLSEGGNVQVSAPAGLRDDIAMGLALACLQVGSAIKPPAPLRAAEKVLTPFEQGMAQIERQRPTYAE